MGMRAGHTVQGLEVVKSRCGCHGARCWMGRIDNILTVLSI